MGFIILNDLYLRWRIFGTLCMWYKRLATSFFWSDTFGFLLLGYLKPTVIVTKLLNDRIICCVKVFICGRYNVNDFTFFLGIDPNWEQIWYPVSWKQRILSHMNKLFVLGVSLPQIFPTFSVPPYIFYWNVKGKLKFPSFFRAVRDAHCSERARITQFFVLFCFPEANTTALCDRVKTEVNEARACAHPPTLAHIRLLTHTVYYV